MKIWFAISQLESLANGHEADNSTELVEVPVNSIPHTLRLQVLQLWRPWHKKVEIGGKLPVLVKPITVDAAIASLQKLFNGNKGNTNKDNQYGS